MRGRKIKQGRRQMSANLFDAAIKRRSLLSAGLTLGGLAFASPIVLTPAAAQKKYDTGATDRHIKIGNIIPYNDATSGHGAVANVEAALFQMINDQGGVNGREISFISYDDGGNPTKAIEQARRLVEGDEVLLLFNSLGTESNTATRGYLNQRKVPQLFVASAAAKFGDPKNYPWTMGWAPNFRSEAHIYAKYILENHPRKTIGILYEDDDFGNDCLIGIDRVLGDQASKLIVAKIPYETTDATVDLQIIQIKQANPDIFISLATDGSAAQAIGRAAKLNWHPITIVPNVSTSVDTVLRKAGFENSQGILSTAYMKDPGDPQWQDDPAMKRWSGFMDRYYPTGNKGDPANVYGYGVAQGLISGPQAVRQRFDARECYETSRQS